MLKRRLKYEDLRDILTILEGMTMALHCTLTTWALFQYTEQWTGFKSEKLRTEITDTSDD